MKNVQIKPHNQFEIFSAQSQHQKKQIPVA